MSLRSCVEDGRMSNNVDIVIRGKNEHYWLSKLIPVLVAQKNVSIYLCYVDSGSDDGSLILMESLGPNGAIKSVSIKKIERFRPGFALNVGASLGASEYIINLSAHCIPKSDHYVSELVEELENAGERCVGVFGQQLPLSGSGAQNAIDLILTYPREPRVYRRTPIFNNANSIIRREIHERIRFDNDVTNLEDFIWAKQILEEGFEIKYSPIGGVYHLHGLHQHATITTARAEKSLAVLLEKKWISFDTPWFCDINKLNVQFIEFNFENGCASKAWTSSAFKSVISEVALGAAADFYVFHATDAADAAMIQVEKSLRLCHEIIISSKDGFASASPEWAPDYFDTIEASDVTMLGVSKRYLDVLARG